MDSKEIARAREKILAETIWLHYFNRYLFQHGTITEREHIRMLGKITESESKAKRKLYEKTRSDPPDPRKETH